MRWIRIYGTVLVHDGSYNEQLGFLKPKLITPLPFTYVEPAPLEEQADTGEYVHRPADLTKRITNAMYPAYAISADRRSVGDDCLACRLFIAYVKVIMHHVIFCI